MHVNIVNILEDSHAGFYLGNCFCGERKCEKHPKNKQNFFIVWGGNLKLRGKFPP